MSPATRRVALLHVLLSSCLVFCHAADTIRFPSHIASHMVIQRGQPFALTGVAGPHSTIKAAVAGQTHTGTTDSSGAFNILLPSRTASTTPITISVASSGGATNVLVDVLVGDVYISSGQSNMELSVSWCYNYARFVAESPTVGATLRIAQVALLPRYYNVTEPQTNLTLSTPWSRADTTNVAGMSAIAYFTALEMVRKHPDVPIGAIASSWGGTAMEPWMPPAAFSCGDAPGKVSTLTTTYTARNADPGLYSAGRHPMVELEAGPPGLRSTLWNSMIAPLLTLKLSGWFWYQGESNCGQKSFSRCFPAMITAWREEWKSPEVPFIFFQLAPWPSLNGADGSCNIAAQRAAQVNATNLHNVGMVVTADRGDASGAFHPIHPPVKEELSHRAFLVTDRLVYENLTSPLQGPQPIKATFEPWQPSWGDYHFGTGAGSYVCKPGSGFRCGGIKVEFDQELVIDSSYGQSNSYVDAGLAPSRPSSNDLLLWDNTSTKWQRAEIVGVSGKVLQLNTTWTFGEDSPAMIKYAMSDYPVMPFYNSFGLPTPPFELKVSIE